MRVLTDLDDVLGDFTQHVRDHFGAHPNDIPTDDLWTLVDSVANFWLTMPLKYGARDLWDFIQPYHPVIITGCPKLHYEKAAADKVTWAKSKFGEGITIITCLSRDKQKHLLTPDDILIDDFSNNVKRWRQAGGRALRYITYEQTISDLRTFTWTRTRSTPSVGSLSSSVSTPATASHGYKFAKCCMMLRFCANGIRRTMSYRSS